jgi:hypothetical protein
VKRIPTDLVAALAFLVLAQASAQDAAWRFFAPGYEDHLERLAQKNGITSERRSMGTNPRLARQLLAMQKQDQAPRTSKERAASMADVDSRLTAQLQAIVKQHGWPTIQLVGFEASSAAALILIHTSDQDWQRRMIPILEGLAAQDKIDKPDIAYITDKLLTAEGKPQRFGTQLDFSAGKAGLLPVEDPERLNQRRAAYWLGAVEDYLSFAEAQHASSAKK